MICELPDRIDFHCGFIKKITTGGHNAQKTINNILNLRANVSGRKYSINRIMEHIQIAPDYQIIPPFLIYGKTMINHTSAQKNTPDESGVRMLNYFLFNNINQFYLEHNWLSCQFCHWIFRWESNI